MKLTLCLALPVIKAVIISSKSHLYTYWLRCPQALIPYPYELNLSPNKHTNHDDILSS